MPPSLELIETSAQAMPGITCRDCPEGAAISLTVFLRGVGDVQGGQLVYSQEEEDFIWSWADAFGAASQFCCESWLYVAFYDPRQRAATNGELIAGNIDRVIAERMDASPWLVRVHLHLVGFSAGGVVGVYVTDYLECGASSDEEVAGRRRRERPVEWCETEISEVELEIDLVTMATPFDLGGPIYRGFASAWSGFLEWIGSTRAFSHSIPGFYGGGPPPRCLCRMVSLVSSGSHGDDSPGADRDPREDGQLEQWHGEDGRDLLEVVELAAHWQAETVTHNEVPARVLDDFPGLLEPGCRCVPPSGPP